MSSTHLCLFPVFTNPSLSSKVTQLEPFLGLNSPKGCSLCSCQLCVTSFSCLFPGSQRFFYSAAKNDVSAAHGLLAKSVRGPYPAFPAFSQCTRSQPCLLLPGAFHLTCVAVPTATTSCAGHQPVSPSPTLTPLPLYVY